MTSSLHASSAVAAVARPHRLSRPTRLTLAFLGGTMLVGLAATLYALLRASPERPFPPALVLVAAGPVLLAATANLGLRFIRWQFLLRRLGVRLPSVESLGAFAGSFAFLPVPLLLGQLVARARLVPGLDPAARGRVVFGFVLERALDAWALALLATLVLPPRLAVAVTALAAVAFLPGVRRRLVHGGARVADFAARTLLDAAPAVSPRTEARVGGMRVVGVAALLSVLAWAVVVAAVAPLAAGSGAPLGLADAIGAGALSILAGGLSLVPLGSGVAGLVLIRTLRALGLGAIGAAHVTFVFRVGTAWFSVVLGAIALVALRMRRPPAPDHFDAIDECYDAWVPLHYREHLVQKKMRPVRTRLAALGPAPRGLDIGCGRGWYVGSLERDGVAMVGLDLSRRQLVAAGERLARTPLVQGSVVALPFADATFDFAYVINVLHHLPSRAHQRTALAEIARVLRPGGILFVHEMSMRNPIFRIYAAYIFPILKNIDEGTEYFLDPRALAHAPAFELTAADFFTFLPDFVPARLMPLLEPLERRLEATPLRRWAAHFLAVLTRTGDPPATRR